MSRDKTNRSVRANIKFIFLTAIIVAVLVIAAAILNAYVSSGTAPSVVMQFIASGAFGKQAFAGGLPMVLWGCLFHFLIATSWTLLFYLLYPRTALLAKNRIVSGIAYGSFIWFFMTFVVMQLDNTPKQVFDLKNAIVDVGICITTAGLPVAVLVGKYYSRKAGANPQ